MTDPQHPLVMFVHEWFEHVWNRGDEAAIHRLMAPTAQIHGLAGAAGAPLVGPAAFVPFFRQFRQAFPDLHVTVARAVCDGELVVAHCHVRGTHLGHGLGVAPSTAAIDIWGMSISRVHQGQLVEGWNTFDFLSLYQQIGLVAAPR